MVAENQSKAPPTDKPPHPETSQRDHAAHVEAWVEAAREEETFRAERFRLSMRLDYWSGLPSLTPREAALLLSGHEPDEAEETAKPEGLDERGGPKGPEGWDRLPTRLRAEDDREEPPTPDDAWRMRRTFEREPESDRKPRDLTAWFVVATAAGLKVDGMMLAHFGKAQQLTEHDHVRRLRVLRERGGSVSMLRGEVQIRGIGGLVKAEKKVGALRASEKTIRADLSRAFEEEREGPGSRDSVPAASIFPGSPRRPIG